jgi:hypothetical protein
MLPYAAYPNFFPVLSRRTLHQVFSAAESITICIAQLFLNVATAFAAESKRELKVLRSRFLFGSQNNSPAEAGPLSSDV